MRFRNSTVVIFTCFVIFIAGACGMRGDDVLGTWDETNGAFKIRITAYDEKLGIPPQRFYYTFEASGPDSTQWHEIMTCRRKNVLGTPHEQVKFVANHSAYVFLADKFATTIDAGRTWSVWDGYRIRRDMNINYGWIYIRSVSISADGAGEMVVAEASLSMAEFSEARDVARLRTSDYGQHWTR